MTTIKVIRVFTNEKGLCGNPVGIVVDEEGAYSALERQKVASKTGFSETVFVNNLTSASIRIYNPQDEVAFAGHAVVGTAWLFLQKLPGKPVASIQCGKESIQCWPENDLTWINAPLTLMPPWELKHLEPPTEIDALTAKKARHYDHTMVWAWLDETAGTIRARTFAPAWGISEDEANGSGSMLLATELKREITIYHGKGSVIHARPSSLGFAEIGGLVKHAKDLII